MRLMERIVALEDATDIPTYCGQSCCNVASANVVEFGTVLPTAATAIRCPQNLNDRIYTVVWLTLSLDPIDRN
jgi:hypothetical protein